MAGPDGAAREAAESTKLGFRCVKYKVGYQQVEQDRAVIRAARSEAGKDLQVMVDYNQSLSVAEAIRRIQFLEDEALVWVEEPTCADDLLAMPESPPSAELPFRSAKTLWGPHGLTKSLSVGASDFVMLDVMKIGGIPVGSARSARLRLPVYLYRVTCSRKSAHSFWRFHHERTGWNTRIGSHRSYSDPSKLKMVSRFSRRRPAAASSGTKTPFNTTGFARHQPLSGS